MTPSPFVSTRSKSLSAASTRVNFPSPFLSILLKRSLGSSAIESDVSNKTRENVAGGTGRLMIDTTKAWGNVCETTPKILIFILDTNHRNDMIASSPMVRETAKMVSTRRGLLADVFRKNSLKRYRHEFTRTIRLGVPFDRADCPADTALVRRCSPSGDSQAHLDAGHH